MADVLAIFLLVLHVIQWPIINLVNLVIVLLSPFYLAASFFLLPILHLGHAIIGLLTLPFGIQWQERFETIYIFLGIASLVGCLTGAIVFVVYKFLSSSLSVDATLVPKSDHHGRTAAEYRATKRERGEAPRLPSGPTPVTLNKITRPRKRALVSQAIIGEEDSDF